MLSIIHYISACRRYKESEKTVTMMGGESECNEMVLGQRDMIKLERDYYKAEAVKGVINTLLLAVVVIISYIVYLK